MEVTTTYYIGFILIALIVAYIIVVFYKGSSTETAVDFTPADGPLHQETMVLNSDATRQMLLGGAGSTLMVYLHLKGLDKTAKANDVAPTVFRIRDAMELRCTSGATGMTAELLVNTKNTATGKAAVETITLPHIPFQKWICLSVLRDGRRFDIMYNDKIVASKRLAYMPIYITSPLVFGGPGVMGVYNMGRVFNYRLSLADAKKELARTSDTRHKPKSAGNNVEMGSIFGIFKCPGGAFCGDSTPAPKSPLEVWETPYA